MKLPLYNGGEIETVCFLQFVGMLEGIQYYLNVTGTISCFYKVPALLLPKVITLPES